MSPMSGNKAERLKAVGLLHPSDIPNNKWESTSMDFIVTLNPKRHLLLPLTQKGMMPYGL